MFRAKDNKFDITIKDLIDHTLYIVTHSDDTRTEWYYQDLYDRYQILDMICEAKANHERDPENFLKFEDYIDTMSIAIAEEF